jgi:hypothetical protein
MEAGVLVERLRREWDAQVGTASIHAVMGFEPEGLTLGVGTILVPALAKRQLQGLAGQEARLLALLSAAHECAVIPAVLGNIRRAVKSWQEGDDCLAAIHLALARLPRPENSREAARRVFMADGLIEAGVVPREILRALDLDTEAIDAVEKRGYDHAEPRVPPDSGDISGEWTSALGRLASAAAQLGEYATRFPEAELALGFLFIPSNHNSVVDGKVSGQPNLTYHWDKEEGSLRVTYGSPDGKLVFFDDCQHETGMMVEAKGNYDWAWAFQPALNNTTADWLDQSKRQLEAAGDRPVRWYFAQSKSAEIAKQLFARDDEGRERIEIVVLPKEGSSE